MDAILNTVLDSLVQKIADLVFEKIKSMMKRDKSSDDLMTIDGVAKYLNVEKDWIYRNQNNILRIKITKKVIRYSKQDIDKWLEKQKVIGKIPSNLR